MKVLIGCEESQAVTIAFRELGHEAFSCDLKTCSGGHPEWHMQMDIYEAITMKKNHWDFIGLHPVCTKMTLSGNRHYAPGKQKHKERLEAVEWTILLYQFACSRAEKVYMENPMGAMNGDPRLPKPQIIHPYFFGDEARKQTCIWLKGLKPLLHSSEDTLFEEKTHVGQGESYEWVDTKTGKTKRQPLWYAQAKGFGGKAISRDFSETRSKTFSGISKAMAAQWG